MPAIPGALVVDYFLKLRDNHKTRELAEYHDGFMLLYFIARRAYKGVGVAKPGRRIGQATIGREDVQRQIGLTEQRYRLAKKRLEEWGIVTSKTTNKGTIITLCDSTYYDVNWRRDNEQNNEQTTSRQRANNEQTTSRQRANNEPTTSRQRADNEPTTTSSRSKKEEGESVDVAARTDSIEFGDAAHQVLVEAPQFHHMTYEQDMAARYFVRGAKPDYLALAHEARREVAVFRTLDAPGAWWKKFLLRQVDGNGDSEKKDAADDPRNRRWKGYDWE